MGFLSFRELNNALLLLGLAALCVACGPGLPKIANITPAVPAAAAQALSWSGAGSDQMALPAQPKPAILHITAKPGSAPLKVLLRAPSGLRELVNAAGDLDEYRGVDLSAPATLEVMGDRAWKVDLLPLDSPALPNLRVPGTFPSRGSAAVRIEGKYSIAIFSTRDLNKLNAWAYGPGVSAPLSFKVSGTYKGRAVLPENTAAIVVVAREPWAMEVQIPCCEIPQESK